MLMLVAFFATNRLQAQEAPPPPPQQAPPPIDWTPHAMDYLRQIASSKTEFSLDHSMLIFAAKIDDNNDDLRRVIAGISGISVHEYRFQRPWMYDPDAVNSVRDEYHQAGWKQLVNHRAKDGSPGASDVWLRFENNAIANIALLFARANEVDFIVVNGSISPLDLTHLGGHFGIPKIEGGITVPTNPGRR